MSVLCVLQPPKKKAGKKGKKGKKKSAKAKTPTVIDGVSTEEMSKEQVRNYFIALLVRTVCSRLPVQIVELNHHSLVALRPKGISAS